MLIIGIDLAAKVENETGLAIIDGKNIFLETVFTDNEILARIYGYDSPVVVIDAPLSLPQGRCCLEKDCACSIGGHFRQSEREIRKYGPVLPLTFAGMKMLTFRGMDLRDKILNVRSDLKIMETHPRTVQKILGLARDVEDVYSTLNSFFGFNKESSEASPHEIDAVLAALTGLFYCSGQYQELGDSEEGTIIIPLIKKDFFQDMMDIQNIKISD